MSDPLENLAKVGSLKVETATPEEVAGLIQSGMARLKDAKNETLQRESRFDLAYNAAHAFALAALRAFGYRSENRYTVFQCLKHTLNVPNEQWRLLDQAHRKRNVAEYEGMWDVDDALLAGLIRTTELVAERVQALD